MGCDIHEYYEVRDGDTWRRHDYCEPFYTGPPNEDGYRPRDYKRISEHPLYLGRNYNLFAILADVRNGRGFAGVETGEGFNPITDPRGLPEDVTPEVLDEFCIDLDDYEPAHIATWLERGDSVLVRGRVSCPDWHSASWFTLRELQEYDWQQTTGHQGWVGAAEFKTFQETGKPVSWCGGVSGRDVQHISNDLMLQMIAESVNTDHCYTLVKWGETYAASCHHFVTKALPAMAELADSPDDVRLVFWFDN